MATRPYFNVNSQHKFGLITKRNIEFEWFSGFAISQKQKSINALHNAIKSENPNANILEISSKSPDELGIKLSAFNLMITTNSGQNFSVESAFQSSKIFENAGPFSDLLTASSKSAKTDPRLKKSGEIIGFKYFNRNFPLEPKTYFYNWLYINTLHTHSDLAKHILQYNSFTDIEFNPNRSINCQAEAAALYVSLTKNGLIDLALTSKEQFKKIVYAYDISKHTTEKHGKQIDLL